MRAVRAILLSVLCVVVAACSRRSAKPDGVSSGLVIAVTQAVDTIRMGRLVEGENPEKTFLLKNDTACDVVLLRSETTCGCVELDFPSEPIAAGESVRCSVSLYSTGYSGRFTRTINLHTSLGSVPLRFVIEAQID